MPIFKVYSDETRDCQVEYTVEAADESAAVDHVQRILEMTDQEVDQWLRRGPILEVNIEETDDVPSYQDVRGVNPWGR